MKFLNKETEKLLKECLENSSKFPKVLADKFDGLSNEEDTLLRSQIKTLIDNGYFSKLQWADNVPWFGSITEDGYDYFHKKNVYIRAKLKERDDFYLLDKKAEKVLQLLIDIGNAIYIGDGDKGISEIMTLSKYGYVSLVRDSDMSSNNDSFYGMVSLTEDGKNYFKNKETIIEEIVILSEDPGIETQKKHKTEQKQNNRAFGTEAVFSQNNEARKTLSVVESNSGKSNKIVFTGILGNNCGTVVPYTGGDPRLKEKGYVVENGIPVLRGFAKISEIARASHAQYEQYQRERDPQHVDDIAEFLRSCKDEAKFLPEVVLSVNDPSKASLVKFRHKSFINISDTAKGAIDNINYYALEAEENSLTRVDGNHRLEAGINSDYYIPFAIIVWNCEPDREGNILSDIDAESNDESEAFLFYFLNNTAKKLEAEENYKGLVKSENWSEEELARINRQLPILKYFNEKYAGNPLVDSEVLYEPLSQICEVLTEIDSPDLGKEEFDVIFQDTIKLLPQFGKFDYAREQFKNIFFQLVFYARYKSDNYNLAIRNLTLVDKWLEKYKYSSDTFTKASKIYDIAYKFISSSPKSIFMAMEYKSEQIVDDYNGSLVRAVTAINNMGGNIEIKAYPIMSYKGKSVSITADIYSKIDNCSIFIADTTEANPNVMYELGIAYDKKKPIIMVREKGKHIKVPSDIISDNYYRFSGMTELEKLFVEHIKEILINDYGAIFPE